MDNKKRILSFILALVMIVTILPMNIFAVPEGAPVAPGTAVRAVDPAGKPQLNWDASDNENDDGSAYWTLPAGVRVIHGQNGVEPVNTIGISYLGKYITNENKLALKFDISQDQTVTSAVWKWYVMRFPKELYTSIDWDKSYITRKSGEAFTTVEYLKFTDSTIPNQTAYTKQFNFIPQGSGYGHYEVNLILKSNVNWDKDFARKSQVVQLRLYDSNGKRIFSSSTRNSNGLSKFGYNTYTKVAVIGETPKKPTDLIESTTISRYGGNLTDDMFRTTYSVMQLDKENKKVRIIYVPTKSNTDPLVGYNYNYRGENLAIRQSFDPEFIRYLNLSNPDGEIGKFYVLDNNENAYGDEIVLYAKDITGIEKDSTGKIKLDQNNNPTLNRDDGAVFIQLSEYAYKDKEDSKLDATDNNKIVNKGQPKGKGSNIFRKGSTIDGYFVVFEYDIDPQEINKTLITEKEFIKNFAFDTRYITDNNFGMRKFTAKVKDDILVQPNTKTFMRFVFTPDVSISDKMVDLSQKYDFIVNVGGTDGNWYSWKRERAEWKNVGSTLRPSYQYFIPFFGYNSWSVNNNYQQPTSGKKIAAGSNITLYLPTYYSADSVKFDIVTTDGNPRTSNVLPAEGTEYELEKVTDPTNTDPNHEIFYYPMYHKNTVSTIGGSAVREQFAPIVDEIFTTDTEFTGIMRAEGGVLSTLYKPEKSNTKKYFGSNWLDSESDKNGDVEKYYRTDGKLRPETLKPNEVTEKKQFNKKEYEGYKFKINAQYTGGEDIAKSNEDSSVESIGIIKDQPIRFNTFKYTTLNSEPVYEQVQARVDFILDSTNNSKLTRIVPLNNKYSIIPEFGKDENGIIVNNKNPGTKNKEYVGNGFENAENSDNIRIDTENKEVTIERKNIATDTNENVKYPNFINHDGFTYDLNESEEKNQFMMRLFPDAKYDADLIKGNKTVIGWTTSELKDIPNGKTAQDQFYMLQDLDKEIKTLEDWKKVDDDHENMIFTSTSPVDKYRKVYAVYGTPSLVLHSNNTDDPTKETIVRIPYDEADKLFTAEVIDAMTTPTPDLKEKNTIKKVPVVPYKYDSPQDQNEKFDERFKNFVKENSTFVGWTAKRYKNDATSEFAAGNFNSRIGEVKNGKTADGKSIPKNTIPYNELGTDAKAYLPNGYSVSVEKGFNNLINEGKDYHLYANYRPYFAVKVNPRFMDIDMTNADPTNKKYGEYVNLKDQTKKHNLKIGLLYRTAVTGYDKPTVLQSATYYPLKENGIKDYNPNFTDPLTWTEPGFDREGFRKSFVAIVVPEGKEDDYNKFNENKWGELGISVYVKISGTSAEIAGNAPKNLHRNAGDPYGQALAKRQAFSVANTSGGVDAFTSATSRKPVTRNAGEFATEVTGYEIVMTNSPRDLIAPHFKPVKETDTEIKLDWGDAEKNAGIDEIEIEIPSKGSNPNKSDKKTYTLKKDGSGNYSSADGLQAEVKGDALVITKTGGLDLSGLPTDENERSIFAVYKKNDGGTTIESPQAKTVIKEVLTSNPVTDIAQTKNDKNGSAQIKFTVPNPITNQVQPGTKYTAQVYKNGQWNDVGSYTIPETDLDPKGKTVIITLDGTARDKDLVRVVSEEPDKNKAYSVGNETDKYTPQDPNIVSGPYAILDLEAPTFTGKAEDERFRRWINLKGTLSELPDGEIIIEIGTKGPKGTEGNLKITLENKGKAIEEIDRIVKTQDDYTGIWIYAKDQFGNEDKLDNVIQYTPTKVFTIQVYEAYSKRNFIFISSSAKNGTLKIKVKKQGGSEVVLQDISFEGNNNDHLERTKYNLLNKDNTPYTLQKGDRLYISGEAEATDGGENPTLNPFVVRVRR